MATKLAATSLTKEDFFHPPDVPDRFKKAVGVVQVAMGKLGFLHRKLYNVLHSNASEGLEQGHTKFTIRVKELAELAGFDSNDYRQIYDHCQDLTTTKVGFVDFDDKPTRKGRRRRSVGAAALISEFKIYDDGTINYEFSSSVADALRSPDKYIWMVLSAQRRFNSKYELGLFENCIRYLGTGTTGFKGVEEWRELLGATEETYSEFKRFNGLVVKPAVKGVNEKSGIIIEPEMEREKRKVARIKFNVRENPQMFLLDHQRESRIRDMDVYRELRKFGLKDTEAIHWVETKGEEYVLEIVAYVRQKKPKNQAAYLVSALHNGYGQKTPEERQKEAEAQQRALDIRARQVVAQASEKAQEELEAHFRRHQQGRVQDILKELSEAELADVTEIVSADIPIPAVAQQWARVDQDVFRVKELNKAARGIMNTRLRETVLNRWGLPEDKDLGTYRDRCFKQS